MNTATQLAAVDLGPNSFRLEIGRADGSEIHILSSLRVNIRLAAGLDAGKMIDSAAQERALVALAQFAGHLEGFSQHQVRVVATNTLRVAKNAAQFIERAGETLGFPVEVIAGREEARLIFSGVAHSERAPLQRQLVIDIGGGSTEFSAGSGFDPDLTESLYMGSINHTVTHFPGGFIDSFSLRQAELAARREVQVIAASIAASGWQSAIASSGTARSIARMLREAKVSDGDITSEGMRWVRKAILCARHIHDLDIGGLKLERALNLPGGFAILSAIFTELGISSLKIAGHSLCLGVLYGLLDRANAGAGVQDKRALSVAQFAQRFQASPSPQAPSSPSTQSAQLARVAALTGRLLVQLRPWLGSHYAAAACFVDWAARLHETGLTIAHTGYHRHSAYLVSHADLPGFSRPEQQRLAFFVLGHTGKLSKLTRSEAPALTEWLALACLRLGVLFHRSRQAHPPPDVQIRFDGADLTLAVDDEWLRANALTAYSLKEEARQWQALGAARPFAFSIVGPPVTMPA